MHIKVFKPFLLMAMLILIIGLACSSGTTPTQPPVPPPPTATPAPEKPTEPVKPTDTPVPPPEEPTATAEEPAAPDGSVTSLDEMESAVVDIEVEGSYQDPSEGWKVNTGRGGTGFIIDPSGLAVTNNHVVTGAALIKVYVQGHDQPLNARVIGASECLDLAVIDIEGDSFPYMGWYSGDIKAGMDVFAAGFPGSATGVDYTLTKGIVSKAKTKLDSIWASVPVVVAHSAKVNPGNSGGPLVNEKGEVLGINYASVASTDENYAISRDAAKSVLEELKAGKDIDSIGVNGVVVSGKLGGEDIVGVWVRSVKAGSPADKSRLQPGDIIVELASQILVDPTMKDYCAILRAHGLGDTMDMTVVRAETGEIFKGQLNGREMASTGNYYGGAPSSGGGSSSGGSSGDGGSTSGGTGNPNASKSGEVYYSTEFDNGVDEWTYFLTRGKDSGFTQDAQDGKFRVEIKDKQTYAYFLYKDLTFTDVRVDLKVENLGVNTNYVGIFCRYTSDGWYDIKILNTGEYEIYYYDSNASGNSYKFLYSGGSRLINTGKDVNEYTVICQGDEITLGINGTKVKTLPMKTGGNRILRSGQAGISVASLEPIPVIVEFDYVTFSVP